MEEFYVYAHYKPGSDIPFYIGKGKKRRAYKKTRNNPFWKNIVNKYGFEVKIIIKDISEEDSLWFEEQQISAWGRRDLGLGPLVNMTDGGDTTKGLVHTKESKRKISIAGTGRRHTDEVKLKMGKSKLGIPKSAEHKNKLRLTHLGRKQSEECIRKSAQAHRGLKRSEETKRKMRLALKGRKCTEAQREINRKCHMGLKHSEETKRKMKESQTLRRKREDKIAQIDTLISTNRCSPEGISA